MNSDTEKLGYDELLEFIADVERVKKNGCINKKDLGLCRISNHHAEDLKFPVKMTKSVNKIYHKLLSEYLENNFDDYLEYLAKRLKIYISKKFRNETINDALKQNTKD